MTERGIVTVCFDRTTGGERYGRQAFGLLGSVRSLDPDIPIKVLTNIDAHAAAWEETFGAEVEFIDLPDDRNREVKTSALSRSPYERTMQIDVDVVAKSAELFNGFRWLDRFDLVLTTHQDEQMVKDHRKPEHVRGLAAVTGSLAVPYFCSGLMFYGRGRLVQDLFRLWHGLYISRISERGRQVPMDMYPLNVAIWLTHGLSVLDMGWRYSCKEPDNPEAIAVHCGGRSGSPLVEAQGHYNRAAGLPEEFAPADADKAKGETVLLAGPIVAELGWEIGNLGPHIRSEADRLGADRVYIVTTQGRAALYPWADGVVELPFSGEDFRDANFLLDEPVEVEQEWAAMVAQANEWHAALADVFGRAEHYCPVQSDSRTRYDDEMTAVQIEPDEELVEQWREELARKGARPDELVICPTRNLSRGERKNTDPTAHFALTAGLAAAGYVPVTIGGLVGTVNGIDLRNRTDLADVTALYKLALAVVGPSTGTMHLAAAVGTPHVVWGGDRQEVADRYLSRWNLNGVPCRVLGLGWEVSVEDVAEALGQMLAEVKEAGQ